MTDSLNKWDLRFYELACKVAEWSKDPRKKVGAVVVSADKRHVSYGYNGFPSAIADDDRLNLKEVKNTLCLHAEVNSILNARNDVSGWSLYCSKAVCLHCALVIVQAGIVKVTMPAAQHGSSWLDSCENAISIFKEASVTINLITGIPYYV